MISFLVKLGTIQLRELRAIAKRTGISVSEHIRRAIDHYLRDQK